MDSELIKGRDEAYRRLTHNDPSGEKRTLWEVAYGWGMRQGYEKGQTDLRSELQRLLSGTLDDD